MFFCKTRCFSPSCYAKRLEEWGDGFAKRCSLMSPAVRSSSRCPRRLGSSLSIGAKIYEGKSARTFSGSPRSEGRLCASRKKWLALQLDQNTRRSSPPCHKKCVNPLNSGGRHETLSLFICITYVSFFWRFPNSL